MIALFRLFFFGLLLVFHKFVLGQDYQWFSKDGEPISFESVLAASHQKDLVFFGEYHDDSIAHFFQEEFLNFFHTVHGDSLAVAMEMFEYDDQLILEEYLKGMISESSFLAETKVWSNYEKDYRSILEYCKFNEIPLIASNIPRRYASSVNTQGIEILDEVAVYDPNIRAILPFTLVDTLSQYQLMSSMFGLRDNQSKNILYAQAVKDAIMAQSIQRLLERNQAVFHLNGSFHSDFYQGIIWYLQYYYRQPFRLMTISTVSHHKLKKLPKEDLKRADFILVTKKKK